MASWLIIIVYLWWRFHSFTYGLAAVLAVVHDVLVTLGAIAVSYWLAMIPGLATLLQIDQFKIDLPIVAAFLTLIGFSVNDTIVIFDRIREIKGKTPHLTNKMVNDAINQTLSRTILTSFTAWLVVVILYLFGGEGLHGFAFALVVGFLSGTYSTVYIATPILIDFVAAKPQRPPRRASNWQLCGEWRAPADERCSRRSRPSLQDCPSTEHLPSEEAMRHARRPSSTRQGPVLVDAAPAAGDDPRAQVDGHPLVAEQVQPIPLAGQREVAFDEAAEHRSEAIEDRRQQPRRGLFADMSTREGR